MSDGSNRQVHDGAAVPAVPLPAWSTFDAVCQTGVPRVRVAAFVADWERWVQALPQGSGYHAGPTTDRLWTAWRVGTVSLTIAVKLAELPTSGADEAEPPARLSTIAASSLAFAVAEGARWRAQHLDEAARSAFDADEADHVARAMQAAATAARVGERMCEHGLYELAASTMAAPLRQIVRLCSGGAAGGAPFIGSVPSALAVSAAEAASAFADAATQSLRPHRHRRLRRSSTGRAATSSAHIPAVWCASSCSLLACLAHERLSSPQAGRRFSASGSDLDGGDWGVARPALPESTIATALLVRRIGDQPSPTSAPAAATSRDAAEESADAADASVARPSWPTLPDADDDDDANDGGGLTIAEALSHPTQAMCRLHAAMTGADTSFAAASSSSRRSSRDDSKTATANPDDFEAVDAVQHAIEALASRLADAACAAAAPVASRALRQSIGQHSGPSTPAGSPAPGGGTPVTSSRQHPQLNMRLVGASSARSSAPSGSASPTHGTPKLPSRVVAAACATLLPAALDLVDLSLVAAAVSPLSVSDSAARSVNAAGPSPPPTMELPHHVAATAAAVWFLCSGADSVRHRAEVDALVRHERVGAMLDSADAALASAATPDAHRRRSISAPHRAEVDAVAESAAVGHRRVCVGALRAQLTSRDDSPHRGGTANRSRSPGFVATGITGPSRERLLSTTLGMPPVAKSVGFSPESAAAAHQPARSGSVVGSTTASPGAVPLGTLGPRRSTGSQLHAQGATPEMSSALSLDSHADAASRTAVTTPPSGNETTLPPLANTGDFSELPAARTAAAPSDTADTCSIASTVPEDNEESSHLDRDHPADVTVAAQIDGPDEATATAPPSAADARSVPPMKLPRSDENATGDASEAASSLPLASLSARLRAARAAVQASHNAMEGTAASAEAADALPATPPPADSFSETESPRAIQSPGKNRPHFPATAILASQLLGMYDALGIYDPATGTATDKDKRFFVDALHGAKKRKKSVDNVMKRMVVKEIEKVKRHRDAVMTVLRAVEVREDSVESLQDFVVAHERRPQHFNPGFCEAHLTSSLEKIGKLSSDVVNAINDWRLTLTGKDAASQPFVYKGHNYVKKMQGDLMFLTASPLGTYLAVDVENNVILAHRRRRISRKITEAEMRQRNFYARLAAPAGTLPVSRAAGTLSRRDADLIRLQREAERERRTNSYFAAATAEVANLVLDDQTLKRQKQAERVRPSSAQINRQTPLLYRRKAGDKHMSVRPSSAGAQALQQHAKAALAHSAPSAGGTGDDSFYLGQPEEPGQHESMIMDPARMRVRNAMGTTTMDAITMRCAGVESQGRHLWNLTYYICLLVSAKNRLVRIVRSRWACKRIQRWWRLCLFARRVRYVGSAGTTPTTWTAIARNVFIESLIRAQRAAVRIQRMWRVKMYRTAWRNIITRYLALHRLQRWFREHVVTVANVAGYRRAVAARKIQKWDRTLIHRREMRIYYRESRSCCFIQRAWRAYASRRLLRDLRRQMAARRLLQRVGRGFLARCVARDHRRANVIKGFLRAANSVALAREGARRVYFATHIQCWVRKLWARVLRKRLADARRRELRVFLRVDKDSTESNAVTLISALVRGRAARKHALEMRRLVYQRSLEAFLAKEHSPFALRIQTAWRRFAGRLELFRRRAALAKRRQLFDMWRARLAAKLDFRAKAAEVGRRRFMTVLKRAKARSAAEQLREVQRADHERGLQEGAAVAIQAWMRRVLALRDLTAAAAVFDAHRAAKRAEERRLDAVECIESAWLTYRRRSAAVALRVIRHRAAAIRIQRFARRSIARVESVVLLYELHRTRVVAAVKIQRAWRLFLDIRDEQEEAAALEAAAEGLMSARSGSSATASLLSGRSTGVAHYWSIREREEQRRSRSRGGADSA